MLKYFMLDATFTGIICIYGENKKKNESHN